MKGLSYYNKIPSIERAQDYTREASLAFRELIAKFRDTEYTADAKEKIVFIDEHLAGAKMSIARYQISSRNYVGAIKNLNEVVNRYHGTNQIYEAYPSNLVDIKSNGEQIMEPEFIDYEEDDTTALLLNHNNQKTITTNSSLNEDLAMLASAVLSTSSSSPSSSTPTPPTLCGRCSAGGSLPPRASTRPLRPGGSGTSSRGMACCCGLRPSRGMWRAPRGPSPSPQAPPWSHGCVEGLEGDGWGGKGGGLQEELRSALQLIIKASSRRGRDGSNG
jgi:hypothetical protein